MKIINYHKLLVPKITDEPHEEFKLIQKDKETWEFQHKNAFEDKIEEINLRLKARKFYMIDEETQKGDGMNMDPIVISEETKNSKLNMIIETKEREIFTNSKSAKIEYNKAIMKHLQTEFNLIKENTPFKLVKDKEFFDK